MGKRLALAIGAGRITAVELRRSWRGLRVGSVRERPLDGPGDGGWADLGDALAGLDTRAATVDVALLRPLAYAKVLELPPVRRRDRRALLLRNARRYFPVGNAAVAGDVLPIRPGLRRRAPAAGLAVCAHLSVVSAVADAADHAGLRLGGLVPGPLALAAAVTGRVGRARRGRLALVVCDDGWSELILLDRGVPRLFRPLRSPAAGDPDELAADVVRALRQAAEGAASVDRILVCGAGAVAADLRQALRACAENDPGAPRLVEAPGTQDLSHATLAAIGAAALSELPLLRPDTLRRAWQRRVRRRILAHAGTAAVLLVAAAAVHLRGVLAEAGAVEAARLELAPAVAEAHAARRTVQAVEELFDAAARVESASPAWTELFASLAGALPDSAFLRALDADTGGVRLTGLAASAAAVAAALAAAPGLEDIAFAGPSRRDDAGGRESFHIAAALRRVAEPGHAPFPAARREP